MNERLLSTGTNVASVAVWREGDEKVRERGRRAAPVGQRDGLGSRSNTGHAGSPRVVGVIEAVTEAIAAPCRGPSRSEADLRRGGLKGFARRRSHPGGVDGARPCGAAPGVLTRSSIPP